MSKSKKKLLTEINDSFLNDNKIIFKKYKPIKQIGTGAFGKIYSTIRIEDKSVFAMKTENRTPYNKVLETEAYYLFTLRGQGIPKLISYGHTLKYNILIETLLGKSLYELFIEPRKLSNITDLCLIAIQTIERLEFIHSKDFIYRDVKPENLLIGIDDPNIIYIIDYGLCKKYRSSKTGKHIQYKNIKKFIGTLKYASSNVVKGIESSRRDDLISLGFVLIQLYRRNLPWNSRFKNLDEISYLNTIHSKETFDDGKLFIHLPQEMVDFLKYVNGLKFEEDPDYSFMKGCFKKILNRLNILPEKLKFSWINKNDKKLLVKINARKESSRHRILKSLESNKHKRLNNTEVNKKIKMDFNKENEIKQNFQKTFDDIVNKNTEKKKNKNNKIEYNNIKPIKQGNKGVIKKRNRIIPITIQDNTFINNSVNNSQNQRKIEINTNKNIYINNNNNNIFLNNINIGFNPKENMNFNIPIHRKINTFAPENINKGQLSNINYHISNIGNNNNYVFNNTKKLSNINNLNYLSNIPGNYRYDTMNVLNKQNNNLLFSFDNNKKISQNKISQYKNNHVIMLPKNKYNKLNIISRKEQQMRKNKNQDVKTIHSHNYTDFIN